MGSLTTIIQTGALRRKQWNPRAQFMSVRDLIAIFLKPALDHAQKTVAIRSCFRKSEEDDVLSTNDSLILNFARLINSALVLSFCCLCIINISNSSNGSAGRYLPWQYPRPGFEPQVFHMLNIIFQ